LYLTGNILKNLFTLLADNIYSESNTIGPIGQCITFFIKKK